MLPKFEVGKLYHHPSTPNAKWLCKGIHDGEVWMSQGQTNGGYPFGAFSGYVEYKEPPKPIKIERWVAVNKLGQTTAACYSEIIAQKHGHEIFGKSNYVGICKLTGEFTPQDE